MKFPPFLHSHLRLTLLGTPPNRVFLYRQVPNTRIKGSHPASKNWQSAIWIGRKENLKEDSMATMILNNSYFSYLNRFTRFWRYLFFLFKRQTDLAMHDTPHIDHGQPSTFESHSAAPMRVVHFPGHKIMDTSIAGWGH